VSLFDSELDILESEGISPGIAHELDGRFEEAPGLKLNEGLEGGVVVLVDDALSRLRLDNMINEIWVGK
jgi:hypothetical protein